MFSVLNFILKLCPTVPSETKLMERFAKVGVGAGKTFDASKFTPEVKQAIERCVEGVRRLQTHPDRYRQGGSGDAFGTRAFLKNNFYRMAAAILGHLRQLQGRGDVSLVLRGCATEKLDASKYGYTLRSRRASCRPFTRSGR
jgi:hypothetical protein